MTGMCRPTFGGRAKNGKKLTPEGTEMEKNPNFHEFYDPYWDFFARSLGCWGSWYGIWAVFATLRGTGIRYCDFYDPYIMGLWRSKKAPLRAAHTRTLRLPKYPGSRSWQAQRNLVLVLSRCLFTTYYQIKIQISFNSLSLSWLKTIKLYNPYSILVNGFFFFSFLLLEKHILNICQHHKLKLNWYGWLNSWRFGKQWVWRISTGKSFKRGRTGRT